MYNVYINTYNNTFSVTCAGVLIRIFFSFFNFFHLLTLTIFNIIIF